MFNDEELAGVDLPDDADQDDDEELTYDDDETGDEDEGDADLDDAEGEESEDDDADDSDGESEDDDESLDNPKSKPAKAFAKRLAAERAKIAKQLREELKAELTEELKPKDAPQTQQQQVNDLYADMPTYTREQIEDLADKWGTTPELAWTNICNQHALAKLNQKLQTQAQTAAQAAAERKKNDAIREVAKQRKANPDLPAFDEKRIEKIRSDHKRESGTNLSHMDAYRMLVAEEFISGNATRKVKQDTVKNITKRDSKTVSAGKGGRATPKDIDEMSAEEFAAMREKALSGKLKSKNR